MTGKRGRVCLWYIIMVLDQVCIATSCHYHDGVGQGDGMAQTIICIYQFNTTHSGVHIYTDFVTLVHCSLLQVYIVYLIRRYCWWTDIPTTYRASQLSIELSLSVLVCPHLLSRTQDVSVSYRFAFSPTLTYSIIPPSSIKPSGFILGFAFSTTSS